MAVCVEVLELRFTTEGVLTVSATFGVLAVSLAVIRYTPLHGRFKE